MTQEEFHDYVMNDVLRGLPQATSRKMFGGYGLYLDGKIFGMVTSDNKLYFKADDTTKKQYESAGSKQFIYENHKSRGPVAMPYWTVPKIVLKDVSAAINWAQQAAELSSKKSK